MSAPTFDRKTYAREYARKQRAEKLAAKNASASTCQSKLGANGLCGGVLETITNGYGGTRLICPLCERKWRGLCRDCGQRVAGTVGKAIRCEHHTLRAKQAGYRKYQRNHAATVRQRARDYYQLDEERRAKKNARKRLWRKAHPEKVKEYRRRFVLKHGGEQDSRYLDYHRRYNAQTARQQTKRDEARRAYYAKHPERPAPTCAVCTVAIPFDGKGRPRRTCDACCSPVELKRRVKVAERAAARLAAPKVVVKRPSLRVRSPMPSPYATTGQRLCLTPGCDIVLTGRKKKCTRCKARETQEAQSRIAALRGAA